MNSGLLFIIFLIVFLAFVLSKTKAKGRAISKNQSQKNRDGRKKSFKDFEQERSGTFGESVMTALVARVCDADKRRYVLMRNLYIPAQKGCTEIDALLLHQSGIYVFESKNIAGEISGSIEAERWHQRLNARTEHTFHNPILQNAGHIRALKHFLKEKFSRTEFNVDDAPIYSAIIFSDRCVLKQIPDGAFIKEGWTILHFFQLQERLSKFIKKQKSIFDAKQLEKLYWALEPCTRVSDKVKAEHKKYVNAFNNQQ